MNFAFFVDNILLNMRLDVMISDVVIVTSTEKLIKIYPTVSRVQCVSSFFGLILATILPEVTVLPDGTLYLGVNKMVLVTDGILVLNPCGSWPISFANEFS